MHALSAPATHRRLATWTARLKVPTPPPGAFLALTLVFLLVTLSRGLGLMFGDPKMDQSRVILFAYAHPRAWGACLVGAALLVLLAYLSRIHFAVFLTHGAMATVYAFAAGNVAQAAAHFGSGWQHVAPLAGGVIWHLFIAYITGPLPPNVTRRTPGATRD